MASWTKLRPAMAMEVKGTAFLARRAMADRRGKLADFDRVVRELAAIEPVFAAPILATTRIPIVAFFRLNEELVRQMHGGDVRSYFEFGVDSANWGLTDGPYQKLVTDRSVEAFVASAPSLYRNYYTVGAAEGALVGDRATLQIVGIPAPFRHPYIELGVTGYFKRGLELVSNRAVEMRAITGFVKGDAEVRYEYELRRVTR